MIKQILNGKVLIAGLVIASIMICASLVYILVARPAASGADLDPASAALTVIPAPTGTARTLPPTLTPFPPTPILRPSPAPGEIAVGVYVQPTTGGDGLRVHIEPGLNTALAFPDAAFDSEVFLITDGPIEADGYTWWYLTAHYDTARGGWAAEEYLTAIPSP